MPTINDIAKLAGVSHGTVSNVLNKRGNVSSEKIRRVEQAARELGFTINAQARQLRQGHSSRVAIIIPKVNITRYNDLCRGLVYGLGDSEILVDMYATDNALYKEASLLQQVASTNPIAIVLVSSSVRNDLPFEISATRMIYLEREIEGIPDQARFFGFDYFRAGNELSRACEQDGHKRVAIFSGTQRYSHNRDFIRGCHAVFDKSSLTVDHYSVD